MMVTSIKRLNCSRRPRGRLLVALMAIATAFASSPPTATATCSDLPPSKLQVYNVKAPTVDVVEVPPEQLDHADPKDALVSRHTMMLSATNVAVLFSITHRMLPQPDGSVCDSPSLVRIGFGVSSRLALLPTVAAKSACVRQEMLEHEATHAHAIDETVDRFIDQHPIDFKQAMQTLKEVAAPNEKVARQRWNAGLKALLDGAKQQLVSELQATIDRTDDPSTLTQLETACGSQIRHMEEQHQQQMSL